MRTLILGATLLLSASSFVMANPVIQFSSTNTPFVNGTGHTGSLAYDPTNALATGGTGNTAVGSNIDIDQISGLGTYANSGTTRKCFNCKLNFVTGAVISDVSANGTTFTFSSGGSFTVSGTFDLNGNGVLDAGDGAASGALLSGVFSSPISITTNALNNDTKFVAATIINTMNNSMEGFYGNAGTSVYRGDYSQSMTTVRKNLGGNHYAVKSDKNGSTVKGVQTGMLDGTINDTLVPEPMSVLLFSSVGGVLIWTIRKRRMNASV